MPPNINGLLEFGPFRFDAAERTLWRDERMVPLTPKALDTLTALLASPGRLVEKDELIKAVWPDTFVEEGNLAVQISLLRKTLGGDEYIETIPRRGYRFAAPVHAPAPPPPPSPPLPSRRWLFGAAAVCAAGGAAALSRYKPPHQRVASVAVLPFQMLHGGAEDEGLGIGLADAVITRLGSLDKFIVRPTSAVREFDRPSRDPLAAGVKLGVEAVLDATIQTADGRIRMNAQLIRVSDGRRLWTDTLDVDRADLFTLEDQVSGRLAHSLFGEALPGPPRHRPHPEAHRLVALGRFYRNQWNVKGQRKAIDLAGQAIAIDARYAEAYALRAEGWSLLGYFFGVPPREAYPKAEESAKAAIELDGNLSEGHHAMGTAQFFYRWDFAAAEEHLRRALALNPNSPDSLQLSGLLRTVRHRNADGLAAMRKALEIDPASQWRHVGMSFQYACANQLDPAIEEAKKAHELDPLLNAPMFDLYNLYMIRGEHAHALEWFLKQYERPGGDQAYAASMRDIYTRQGIRAFLEARIARSLAQIQSGAPSPRLVLAQQYAYLGKPDEAVEWIGKAVGERQATVVFINQHPMYASLRGHAGFQAAVRQIGL